MMRARGFAFLMLFCGLFSTSVCFAESLHYTPFMLANVPISAAVRVGNMVYLSNNDAEVDGKAVPGGMTAQTDWVMNYIQSILKKNGTDLAHVVTVHVWFANLKERAPFDAAYSKFFEKNHYPARTVMAGAILQPGALFEMSCTAYVPHKK